MGSRAGSQNCSERTPLMSLENQNYNSSPNLEETAIAMSKHQVEGKLDTYEGVFIPTTLNVLSILMFLRFGYIIGQAGFFGTLCLLAVSYAINIVTTLSISAIATNGIVRGGGAYYMISRSLGPEFGGSIGMVFFLGQVLNAGLNIVGMTTPLVANFGKLSGKISKALPESYWWNFSYETATLLVCTVICYFGASMFARSSKILFVILIVATLSVPVSALFMPSFYLDQFDVWYTGLNLKTFLANLYPSFKDNVAGSDSEKGTTFSSLFGVLFPATAGILAGASMSGDLKRPSDSIPKGTLLGIGLTWILYFLVIVSIAATCNRDLLYADVGVIADTNLSSFLVVMGEFATSLFSALMGIMGAAKMLEAIAKDSIFPATGVFASVSERTGSPTAAIALTSLLTQITIFFDVNQIAVYITMAFLMTFSVTNFACFLLRIASAPNFRPSFRYFNASTAFLGTIACLVAMFITDFRVAITMILVEIVLFALVHYYSSPKPWGDVSQTLIYHQVRKYLLKLRQDHVKYWRPQVLLLVDDPRTCWTLMRFCSHLKKGGLFILGHAVVVQNFNDEYPEVARQRRAWTQLRDACGIKAFVQVSASPSIVWGVRNILLGSGLGGMAPNIVVLGFYNEYQHTQSEPNVFDIDSLPTDNCRKETHMSYGQWVNIIEDLLTMQTNVAIAMGFMQMRIPTEKGGRRLAKSRRYIDLYPIQMSARLIAADGRLSGVSINFDTYTLILNLGAILHTVRAWNLTYDLRVVAFVEHEHEIEREAGRIRLLLEQLRIPAKVAVYSLDVGNRYYDVIVKGKKDTVGDITQELAGSKWWSHLCRARETSTSALSWNTPRPPKSLKPEKTFHHKLSRTVDLRHKRRSLSELQQLGIAHSMQTTRWRQSDIEAFRAFHSESSSEVIGDESDDSDSSDESNVSTQDPLLAVPPSFSKNTSSSPGPIGDNDELNTPHDYSSTDNQLESSPESTYSQQKPSGTISDFNDLPARPQHMILNCLMRQVSADSPVILSTLPAPQLKTHESEQKSKDYHDLLERLCVGLPPILLIHSQSMTVTTSL